MKQRILAILLSLTMMFTLVPTAMAEGETAVAKVGNDKYETLQAAVNAATTENSTVTLLKDVTEDITIPTGVTAMLDLSGKTLTNKAGKHTITVENGGKLNISDSVGTGVVDNTSHGKAAIYNKGEVTLNGGTFERSAEKGTYSPYSDRGNSWYTIANYGTMEINTGVTVENAGGYSSMIRNGGDVTADCNLTIEGGNFAGGVNTVKNDSFGVLTINGGNFSNTAQYVIMNWNKAEITAGTFQTLDTASAVLFTSAYGADDNTVGKLTISGGEFKHASDTQEMIVDHYDESNSGAAAVTGGRFDADISKYIPSDYVQSADGTVEKLGESNAVAKVGDTYYKTLADAVAAAKNDETVTLLKNAETTVELSFTNKAITLDLNGKTVSGTFTDNFSVIEAGEDASLTVQDTSVAGTGKIASNKYGISARDGGALIVKSGTIESEYAPLSGNNTAGDMNFTVNGGTLTAKHGPAIYMPGQVNLSITDGVLNGGISLRMGQVSISGGTINAATDGLDSPAVYYHYSGNAWLPDALYVFGGTYTSENTTYGNSLHLNITGGTFNCANGQGSAVAIYDLGKVEQVMEITISDEAKLGTNSTARNAYDKLSLSDIGVTSPKPGFGAHSGQVSTTITGGLFSSDPSAYVPATHHVEDSGNGSYPFAVKEGAKSDATIIVTAATNAAVSDTIESGDKAKIEAVKDKANVEGMAAAIRDDKKAAIAKAADVTDEQLAGKNMIETEITVKVEAKAADLAKGKLTFEASPVATVKVNGTATGTTVPVTNDMLNGQPITVKLPLPAGFTPKQIKHISSDGSVEYFLKTAKRGAKLFTVDSDNCAVFTITKFSTFELSGTVTYVEPSYYSGSSSDPTYSVTVDKTENGSVTVSPKSASKGDTVTVTVKPDSGYVLETLTVTDKNGNELTLKDKGDGKYTFTMPTGKVEVKATFMEDNSMLNFFYDVPNGAYFYEAVKWAVDKGITNGLSDTMFGPYESCTRAQIVTFLWRAAGSPEPKTASSFTDVPANAYYAKAVAWAVENGITNGMTETTFAPNATCTRGQSVTFLYRALKGTASGSANFTDVKSDAFYADAINWAVANNVTNGTSNTTFSPNADCTRAEIVTFLYRAYQGK